MRQRFRVHGNRGRRQRLQISVERRTATLLRVFETRSLPALAYVLHWRLYVDHSHCPRACASYPSCVAVYPRDSRSRRVLCRSSHSLHSPKSRPISVRQRRNRKFAIAGCYSPTRVGAQSQAQDKLAALPDRRLIRSLSAFSLAKEDQVNENA